MQLQTNPRIYTPDEYLQLEEQAEYKSEYRDGEIIPMTGGTTDHNEISLNLTTNLRFTRLYEEMSIQGTTGLTSAQRSTLKTLGSIE